MGNLSMVDSTMNSEASQHVRQKHPSGWEPGVIEEGDFATAISTPTEDSSPEEKDLIVGWNMDPALWQIVGKVNCRRWQTYDERWLYYYKADLQRIDPLIHADVEALYKRIRSFKRQPKETTGTATFLNLIGDTQLGKALADDTPVLTTNGWTTHGEVVPGDFVFSPAGVPVMVTAVTGSSVQECFKVQFDRNVSLVASGNHLWSGYRQVKNPDYRENPGYHRSDPLVMATSEIMEINSRHFHVDLPSPVDFDESELPVDPYILGAWLGDGNSHTGRMSSSWSDYIDHWQKYLETENWSFKFEGSLSGEFRCVGLTKELNGAGLLRNKHVPESYLMASVEQRLSLLQGLMDTDGYCAVGGWAEFCNTNKNLADAVAWLATSLGMKVTRTGKRGRLNGVDKKWAYLVRFTPDGSTSYQQVFRMERKIERLRSTSNPDQSNFRYVQSVKPVGPVSAQCLTVEGGLYLAGVDLVVTHNSDGDGSAGTIDRWQASLVGTLDRLRSLRRGGLDVGPVALAFMGDLGEGVCGNYPSQPFTTDLTMREQDGILQELIFDTIYRFASETDDLTVIVVPGNHGEVRTDGKAMTLPSDNRDVAVVETVHRGIRRNENSAFDHVKFVYPDNQELTVCMELSGVPVAFAHGHQFGKGTSPAQKAENWWKDQAHGKTPCGDADLLFTAHYHHVIVNMNGRKTHIQIPSLDGGSQWWENMKAQVSAPGMTSVVIAEGSGPAQCGWSKLEII